MVGSWKKCRRTSKEHGWVRGGRRSAVQEVDESEAEASPASSPGQSPVRRRDSLKKLVVKIVRPRSSSIVDVFDDAEYMQNPESKNYRGVRYRVELNKYVTEIRPCRSSKKIWLGTYDTAEEAARAFDIGNLCCKKNLPLNFPDSPRMLRKISSRLSPDEARNAIAKLAKEVARVVSITPATPTSTTPRAAIPKRHHFDVDRAAAQNAIDLLHHQKAEDPEPESVSLSPEPAPSTPPRSESSELRTLHLEAGSASSGITYTEFLQEDVATVNLVEEVATSMPLQYPGGGETGSGRHSWSLGRMFIADDDAPTGLPLHQLIDFRSDDATYGDVLVHSYP